MFGQLTYEQQLMQDIVAQETEPTIKPIYLIGGGVILWLLFGSKIKSKVKKVRRRR